MASETRKTKSRVCSFVFGAQSAIGTRRIGNAVWPPQLGAIWSRLISGALRFAAVGSFGPLSSFWRSTIRSEEHTSELQSRLHLVCRLLLEKKKRLHSPGSHALRA